jgi:uncharacterized membrane protein
LDEPRRLTTYAVAFCLAVSVMCFVVGVGLAFSAPPAAEATVLPARTLGVGLEDLDPVAWLSLAALALIAAPSVRVFGMLLEFRTAGDKPAFVSGVLLLLMLLGNLIYAILAVPT